MKPWHLTDKNQRDNVISALLLECSDWILSSETNAAIRAAIALLKAAAPYGDDELVVLDTVYNKRVWIADWEDTIRGVEIQIVTDEGGQFWMPIVDAEALTPAADSLLRALRGDE